MYGTAQQKVQNKYVWSITGFLKFLELQSGPRRKRVGEERAKIIVEELLVCLCESSCSSRMFLQPFVTATHLHQYMCLSVNVYDICDISGSTVHKLCGQGQQNSSCNKQFQHLHGHSPQCVSARMDAASAGLGPFIVIFSLM